MKLLKTLVEKISSPEVNEDNEILKSTPKKLDLIEHKVKLMNIAIEKAILESRSLVSV
tara:strand:- start:101 stop:274 length:174 start_codon:yes stop_codon:yes gene_type:complete